MIRVPHFRAAVGCVGAMLTALPYWLARVLPVWQFWYFFCHRLH